MSSNCNSTKAGLEKSSSSPNLHLELSLIEEIVVINVGIYLMMIFE